MHASTEHWLSNELERLVAQRERYVLAGKAATNERAKDRHTRNLQRLEEEILGLREALGSQAARGEAPSSAPPPPPAVGTAPVSLAAPITIREATVPAAAEAGAPQVVLQKIDSWPIETPPVVAAEPSPRASDGNEEVTDRFSKPLSSLSIVEPKVPRSSPPPIPPTARAASPSPRSPAPMEPAAIERTSGLFARPTALPVPRALSNPAVVVPKAAAWPAPVGAPRTTTLVRRRVPRASEVPPRPTGPAAEPIVDPEDLSTLEPRRVATESEMDADAFDAVLLRRKITHQAAKIMASAFAVGFVIAALGFAAASAGDEADTAAPGRTGIEPVLASTKN